MSYKTYLRSSVRFVQFPVVNLESHKIIHKQNISQAVYLSHGSNCDATNVREQFP